MKSLCWMLPIQTPTPALQNQLGDKTHVKIRKIHTVVQ